MSVRVLTGTSGYSYPEWKGNFYPEKMAAKDMLRFYAERFPTVEINNTFYRMPTEALLKGWAEQVPDSFSFVLKASKRITHERRLKECDELLSYLFRVSSTLGSRLGPLLFQLPPNFKKDVPLLKGWAEQVPESFTFVLKASQRITHIQRLKECGDLLTYLFRVTATLGSRLGPLLFQLPPNFKKDVPRLKSFFEAMPERRRVAVEFRHASWFDDEVYETLRGQGAALCVADTGEEPAVPLVATTDWGYLRLRREDFGDEELRDWALRIREQPWSDAYVFLKHEEEGKGPKLAARLMEIYRG